MTTTTSAVTLRFPDGRQFGPAPIETLLEWARQGRVPADAQILEDGAPPVNAGNHPVLGPHAVRVAPPVAPGQLGQPEAATLGGLIPTRNVHALVGYYVGIFGALFAILGGVLGVIMGGAAIWLGVRGLNNFRRDNRCRGRTHSIVAIVSGTFDVLVGGLVTAGLVVSILSGR